MELLRHEYKSFISPLSDWKVLDITGLMEISGFEKFKNYKYSVKILQRLKEKKFINIYRCVFNRRNYYYLTPSSIKYLPDQSKALLNDETIFHDAMVSTLCIELLKIKTVIETVELEHKIKGTNTKTRFDEIVPDARVKGRFKGKEFQAAIEIEIHQKEKSRIISKANNYLKNTFYDYAFYFFSDVRIMNNYANILESAVGSSFSQKIFLFTAPEIFNGKNSLMGGTGFVKGTRKNLYEVFDLKSELSTS